MSNKNVQPIKIKISTNVDKAPFELTFSSIYDPAPGERPRRIDISKMKYPYFTADVKYDEKLLAERPYSELLSIFFDKQEFVKVILDGSVETHHDAAVLMENANANIMTMLQLLFPTSYPSKNNINTSYKKYLLKKGPIIPLDIGGNIKDILSSGEVSVFEKRNYSYIKTSRGNCTVSEVVWLNDVLNNKLYRELIEKLIEYKEWREKQTKVIEEDITKTTKQLQNGLTTKEPGKEIGKRTGYLVIDEQAQDELASQKRIYNPDDIKEDMIKIVKKYLTVDTVEAEKQRFDEELGHMLDYFIDTHLKDPKATPITQFVRFKDKFDFTYTSPEGPSDLFSLHKRYDNVDRDAEIAKLTAEKTSKETELDNLTNTTGHIESREWILSKPMIEQYLKNLKKLIIVAQKKKIENGKKSTPKRDEIINILSENITKPLDDVEYDFITILPNVKYIKGFVKGAFFHFTGRGDAMNTNFINQVNERIAEIDPNELIAMDERIKQLTDENAVINAKITKLRKTLEKAFVFKDEEDDPKEPIAKLKKDNGKEITKMQEEIFKYVITRYNRFQDTKRSAELTGQYVEIDTAIDIIIDEIKKLNSLVPSGTRTVDQILNITEQIKNSFDKLVSANKISISRNIGEKLAQIVQLSNQIKFFTQLKTVFFKEPSTGILVEYEKSLDPNDSFTKLIIAELKNEKYSNFKKIIDFIKERFIKYSTISLNSNLEKLLKEYFENQSNDFYDKVVEPANKLLNLGEQPDFTSLESIWDVSVTSVKSSTSETEYAISVYMDVIEGEVNAKNQSEIKCQFLDEELIKRLEELIDEGPVYGPGSNTKVFSVKKAKEEKARHEQEKKKEIELSAKPRKDKSLPIAVPEYEGGKRHTKSFRGKSAKKNRTKKRLLSVFI
uniref:Uncharacterized protein n=1 Tax=viral metagenome TaxID=1070528 RepID=A0A6C0JXG2_9ZZZZ